MVLQELRECLKEKGVVGAGGAGFPTYGKLSGNIKKVILNGAECEPLFKVDRNILKNKSYEVLKGLDIIRESVNAQEGIVAIKEEYKDANKAVDYIIESFNNLNKKNLKGGYPSGDEVVLVYETTGLLVPEGGIPLDIGVMVINVETALNIYNGVINNNPVIEKYIMVGGEVKKPFIARVPIGVSFSELINEAGGSKIKDFKLLVGGPMTGRVGDINECVTKTIKGIFILPKDNPVINLKEKNLEIDIKRAMAVCSQCRMCTDLCPRNLLGYSIAPHKIMNLLAFGIDNNIKDAVSALSCCECNLCSSYACHQNLDPKGIISSLKLKLKENGIKLNKNKELNINEHREFRRVSVNRVLNRLNLSDYSENVEISEREIKPIYLKINFSECIGIPAKSKVITGEKIKKHQVIGTVDENSLGVYLHSPIDGTVLEVNEKFIMIRRER